MCIVGLSSDAYWLKVFFIFVAKVACYFLYNRIVFIFALLQMLDKMYLKGVRAMKHIMIITVSLGVASVAFSEPFYESQILFPLQEQHVHSSSIVLCPNGDLLACWFQGSGERQSMDVVVNGARLKKGETEWSAPFPMADTPDFPDCNPILFIDSQNSG